MSSSVEPNAGAYDVRSLSHERRMLSVYRSKVADGDASHAQPLANACWRASMFEWTLYREGEVVRRLWAEAARTLAEGFARRRPGFDPSPDQLTLALHFAVASREREAFAQVALAAPASREGALRGARAFRTSRAHFHLAEGYALVARSLVERQATPARAAVQSLEAARAENDRSWWERQFPDPLDAAWRASEHESICALLGAVARRLVQQGDGDDNAVRAEDEDDLAADFARTVDETLLRLKRFVETDANHHPKLYVWLPGLAVCALAASAALPVGWLSERYESKADGYERLPFELLNNPSA
ncbi:MAG TPA: hypothetical protein VGP08_04580 [Pyrinomonadaceae bacterium]|nr:hypothetical protein [Pyrinomonadaceae bacterium]